VEAEVQWAWEFDWYRGPIRITDSNGVDVPCQNIREYSVIPGFRERFVFQAAIPSMGYKSFLVHQEASRNACSRTLAAREYTMENDSFKLEICKETGCISTLFDKKTGTEILRNSAKPVVKQDDGDTWAFNVTGYGDTLGYFVLESAEEIENGPVRAIIRTKGNYGNSHIEQDFILYRDLDIIDGTFKVNWREKRKVLKMEFDSLLDSPVVTVSVPYGSVTRNNNGTEFPMGEWMDVSSGDSGLSILSDSVFAYDVMGSTVGLTLLRSPAFGDLRIEPIDLDLDYDMLGQGISEGKWRLVIHDGNWAKAKVPQLAMQFNNPPIVIAEANHPGTRPPDDSFLNIKGDSTILTTAKPSEEGDRVVLRMYEYAGHEDPVHISSIFTGEGFDMVCGKYEIKTLCIDPTGTAKETDMLEG
jgi:alpha-mannosidase